MASVSIQARIDSDVWEAMRVEGETNTQLLRRIATHYQATSGNELREIAPTPAAAVAVLLHSHRLLEQLSQINGLSLAQPVAAPPEEPLCKSEQSAAECADDW